MHAMHVTLEKHWKNGSFLHLELCILQDSTSTLRIFNNILSYVTSIPLSTIFILRICPSFCLISGPPSGASHHAITSIFSPFHAITPKYFPYHVHVHSFSEKYLVQRSDMHHQYSFSLIKFEHKYCTKTHSQTWCPKKVPRYVVTVMEMQLQWSRI